MENNIAYSLFVLLVIAMTAKADQTLYSPNITNWGTFGEFERCPNGTFVKGFRLKTEPFKGPLIDDSCGNGIRLYCGDPLDPATHTITSGEGHWGIWGNLYSCGVGNVVGFQLRVERPHLVSDETATNNLRIFCSNSVGYYIEGDGNNFGIWSTAQICPQNELICGLQTQIQPDQGDFIDDTALNNVNMQCCSATTGAIKNSG